MVMVGQRTQLKKHVYNRLEHGVTECNGVLHSVTEFNIVEQSGCVQMEESNVRPSATRDSLNVSMRPT
jgi:hypothetical protein